MSDRLSIIGVWLGCAAAWSALAILLGFTDPADIGTPIAVVAIGAVALAMVGTGVLVMYLVCCRHDRCDDDHPRFVRVMRQGAWVGGVCGGLVLLQWYGMLLWWTGCLVAGIAVLGEAYALLIRRF